MLFDCFGLMYYMKDSNLDIFQQTLTIKKSLNAYFFLLLPYNKIPNKKAVLRINKVSVSYQ
jgi:hypothetical protein